MIKTIEEINLEISDIEVQQEKLADLKNKLINERFNHGFRFKVGQLVRIIRSQAHNYKEGRIIEIINNRCISRTFIVQLFNNKGYPSKRQVKIHNEIHLEILNESN